MANVQQTKHKMRNYSAKHGLKYSRMNLTSPRWGTGARRNAWRITKHATGRASTRKAAVDAILFPPPLGRLIIRAAQAELGVKEIPAYSNDGPRVKVYQSSTGAYGQPWCASFVTWVVQKVGVKLPQFAWAWVPAWTANRNKAPLKAVSKLKLKPGDIVTLWNDAHIEFFEKWIIKGVLAQCIGGNTAPTGKANNGGMVARTRRYTYEMTATMRASK